MPLYLLISVWGQENESQRAGPLSVVWDQFSIGSTHHVATRSAVMMLLSSLLLFTAFLSLVSEAGGQNWDLEYLQAYEYSPSFQQWVFPISASASES